MNKKEITIDGEVYIKKSKYDELSKKKVKIINKKIKVEINPKDCIVLDPTNVSGIIQIKKNRNQDEDIRTHMGLFRKVEKPTLGSVYNDDFDVEAIIINSSKYSQEYFDKFKKMGGVFFSNVPEFYMMFDEDKNEFLKDSPMIFLYGDNLAFLLAPIVESEEEDD